MSPEWFRFAEKFREPIEDFEGAVARHIEDPTAPWEETRWGLPSEETIEGALARALVDRKPGSAEIPVDPKKIRRRVEDRLRKLNDDNLIVELAIRLGVSLA